MAVPVTGSVKLQTLAYQLRRAFRRSAINGVNVALPNPSRLFLGDLVKRKMAGCCMLDSVASMAARHCGWCTTAAKPHSTHVIFIDLNSAEGRPVPYPAYGKDAPW